MLAHRTRVSAHPVDTCQEWLAGTPVKYYYYQAVGKRTRYLWQGQQIYGPHKEVTMEL